MSRKPRTALTGVPSLARAADSGMPKYARKYRLAESIKRRLRTPTTVVHGGSSATICGSRASAKAVEL
jgi:hypothetical protein